MICWGCRAGESFETLLPKAIVEIPDIKELLREKGGPLSRKSTRKNSCVEVFNSGNSLPLTFTSDPRDRTKLRGAFSHLMTQLREHCEDFPASVIQVKSGVNWKSARRIERSVLFLQSFDDAQILDLAVHLTQCRIDFHFSSPRIVVLDLNGVSSATLVRLFQYAEIPIPTSTTQGAFSVSFINPGEEGYSNAKADRELTKINVTWGRISALSSVPAQIKLSELQRIERFQRDENEIETWIWDTLQGTCPQKVLCLDEENDTDWYMQFHVPTKSERALPTKVTLDDEVILVEHARPYAYLQTGSFRPPAEETMHEHWKNAARLAPSDRKDRSNFVAHVENNLASLHRTSLLHEFPILHQGVRYVGTCEMSQFPILFINGEVTVDRCMCTLIKNSECFPELQDELQESYDSYIQDPPIPNDFRCQTPVVYVLSVCSSDLTSVNIGKIVKGSRGLFVSSTELLRCHAYTKCTVAILLPKGIKLELMCTPSRHIDILAKIPVASSPRQSQAVDTQLTALGINDTNVAELSQALQNSLSLDTNTQSPKLDTCAKNPLKVSCEDNAEEHEGENKCKEKVLPAVSGGTGLGANTPVVGHEYHRETIVSPTASWPPKQDPKFEGIGGPIEESTCLTQEAKSSEVDKSDETQRKLQLELKSLPAPARKDEDLGRNDNGKKQTLEAITEIPEDVDTAFGNCQQEVKGPSPAFLGIEGNGITTSIVQNPNQTAKVPIPGDPLSPKLKVRSVASGADDKRTDAEGTHHVDTYFANPDISNQTSTAKPGVYNRGGTPLITPLEQDDKEMLKTRRSKSVGQFPSTPNKHKFGNGNSKSLPPSRHKSSPLKDMVKKPSKGGKESSILSDFFLPKGGKAPAARYPLRRAGIPNSILAGKEPHNDATCVKNQSTDVPMIDLESIINEEERRINEVILANEIQLQAEAVQFVRDAGEKWLSQVPKQKRNDIEKFAVQFLLSMDSTLCFFTVSLKMIALAPWKNSMVSIDVRQAAVTAISKGWFVKSDPFNAYPFTRAELALAAGSYLGKITPSLADDATVALRAIVELLPIACDEFFAQVSLTCPFCQAKAVGAAPIFSTAVTWKSDEWVDLRTTLEKATPFVSSSPNNWHAPTCDRDEFVPTVAKFGPWAYLEFRPYPVFQDFFPLLSDTASLLADTSILDLGLEVVGLVCSNLAAEDSRHYWLIECSQGRPQTAYDSLKGVRKITLELYRSLSVTGLLLTAGTSKKPVLRTTDLDTVAGRVPRVERQAKPIQVAGRSASYRQRNFLMPKLKNLESPGRNLKSLFHDQSELLSDHPSGNTSRRKVASSRPPRAKADATKLDQRARSNRPKTASASRLMQQAERSGGKKEEVVLIFSKEAGSKVNPMIGDKNRQPKDSSGQPNPTTIELVNEVPLDDLDAAALRKDENQGLLHDATDSEEKDQSKVPLSDPIGCFTSDDEEMINVPSRKAKRPFGEINLDWKAGEHGSLEDQKRRNSGPPQLQNSHLLHTMQEREYEPRCDAARLRAPVDTDPVTESAPKGKACQDIKEDEPKQLLADQQIALDQKETSEQAQITGGYGVITLFDGVSSVVPALTKKFGYAPTVAILAENDIDVRAVVCAEFGYRADEQWSFTPQGTAALYVKDVHSLIANNCHVLRSTIEAYPGLKWIIIGGSPCQDLTFAGPYKGLLGLAGPCSRLFFVFVCIIFTVQQLCGPQAVRFLAENAASMLEMHYSAFCRLLSIDPTLPDKYLWNPSDFGYQITRRRNFFRNYDDFESIHSPTLVFGDHFGPLLRQNGETVPFAPLLRARDTLPNGIIRASWTLYQPHALVWNYDFWNGKANFAKLMAVGTKNIPQCQWEVIIPPPFLDQWKGFLKLLSSHNFQGSDVDTMVLPLVPMFHTGAYDLPFRILKEKEVIQLSGLQGLWNNVSLSDVELVPETLIRNMCGNCFHPDLISSALGSNTVLKSWVKGEIEGPNRQVMNQTEAYAVFSELCEQIEKEAKKRKCKKFQLDTTLPSYEVLHNTSAITPVPNTEQIKNNEFGKPGQPDLGLHQRSFSHGAVSEKKVPPQVSQIHPSTVVLPRKVKVTKEMRIAQHCVAAASQLLTPQQTSALKTAGMQRIFAALRAPVNVNFQFKDYITKLIGFDPGKLPKMSSNPESQCPDLLVVEELHNSFKRWEQQPGVCSIMEVCIAAAACKAGTSWPLGHVLLLPNGAEVHACHVGAEKPKLLFLVDCKQCEYPLVTVVAATVDSPGIPLGTLPQWGFSCWKIRGGHHDPDFVIEQRDCQWVMNIGAWHTQTRGCPACQLSNIGHLPECPWHRSPGHATDSTSLRVVHMICEKDDNTSVVHLRGVLDHLPEGGNFWIFHVCTQQQILQLGKRCLPSQSSAELFVSTLSEGTLAWEHGDALFAPFRHTSLPPEYFRHFFVKAGGQAAALDVWLPRGHC